MIPVWFQGTSLSSFCPCRCQRLCWRGSVVGSRCCRVYLSASARGSQPERPGPSAREPEEDTRKQTRFLLDLCSNTSLFVKVFKQLWEQINTKSAHLFLLNKFLSCNQSQKLSYDSAVLHDGLHVDCLTICKHLVTQAIDWTIPERERQARFLKQVVPRPLMLVFIFTIIQVNYVYSFG